MKKLLALLLALVLMVSIAALAGCAKSEPAADETQAEEATLAEEESEAIEALPALTLTSFSVPIGEFDLSFEPVDLNMLQGADGKGDFSGDIYGGKYYLADEKGKIVYVYAIDGTTATLENQFELEDGYEKVSVSHDGKVYLSPGIFEAVELNSDGTVTELPYRHDVECSSVEDFAVTTWVNADPTVIRGGEESEWVFKNLNDPATRVGSLSMVFDCEIAGDKVIIGGTYAEDEEEHYRIGIFDYDGNRLAISDVEDSVGYSALNGTANGIISANVSKLYLHDNDLKPIGEIKDLKSLAGFDSTVVSTFWVRDICVADDGAVYILIYASKVDETSEALLYKVTGF